MPDNDPKLMTVFAEALERTDPAARAAYLDAACEADAALRARVEALLAALRGAGRFMEGDPAGPCETIPAETPQGTHTSAAEPRQRSQASGARSRPPSEMATGEHGPGGTITEFGDSQPAD